MRKLGFSISVWPQRAVEPSSLPKQTHIEGLSKENWLSATPAPPYPCTGCWRKERAVYGLRTCFCPQQMHVYFPIENLRANSTKMHWHLFMNSSLSEMLTMTLKWFDWQRAHVFPIENAQANSGKIYWPVLFCPFSSFFEFILVRNADNEFEVFEFDFWSKRF